MRHQYKPSHWNRNHYLLWQRRLLLDEVEGERTCGAGLLLGQLRNLFPIGGRSDGSTQTGSPHMVP